MPNCNDDHDASLIEQIIEAELDKATIPDSKQTPAIECQVFFRDGQGVPMSALKRGPVKGTYAMALPAVTQDQHGRQQPVVGKMMEIYFRGSDVTRLLMLRDTSNLVIPAGGRILAPH